VKSIVVGTAGHIDHGKSALVQALTGTDPDRLKEEKARGITIDLGFAHAEIGGHDIAFVDVPGHERFVKNMLAGIGGIDAVMLVIAADESVMPQTREHFSICRLLQIPAGIIVLTKADLADAEIIELAKLDARELVAGSRLEHAPMLEVSAKTGQGLDRLRAELARLADGVPERATEGPPRLPIDRVFSMRGFGTVVTGTLTAGVVEADEEVVILPADRTVKIRGIQVHGRQQRTAGAGRRVAVNLGGADVADIQRGDTLTLKGALEPTRRFDALIEALADARNLHHGARVRFHHGSAELLGRIALASRPDRPGEPLSQLEPGRSAYARIRLEAPAVLTRGDQFILRAYSPPITIGGGRVLDPAPARTPIRTSAAARRFERLSHDARGAALVFIEERAGNGLTVHELATRAGLSPSGADALAAELTTGPDVVAAGQRLFAARVAANLQERLIAAVAEHHRSSPLSEGIPREEARERLIGSASPVLFNDVLAKLVDAGTLTGRDRIALAGRGVSLTTEEADAREKLDRLYRDAGFSPPDIGTAAATTSVPLAVADRVIRLLLRQNVLVKLDTLIFHSESLARLKQDVLELKSKGRGATVDVASFKGRYGISRKYAIPLLEWLDRERITRRVGDARIVV
jgi:selenocysteine-specific elongation factor